MFQALLIALRHSLLDDLISIVSSYARFKGIEVNILQSYTDDARSLVVLPEKIRASLYHPNVNGIGGRLACGSYGNGNTIRVWDPSTGIRQVLEGHTSTVAKLAALPEETGMDLAHSNVASGVGRLASGSYDRTIRIWDLSTRTSEVLKGHNSPVVSLAVLPDSVITHKRVDPMHRRTGRLASGSYDRTIRIWDLSTRTSQVLHGHTDGVLSLAVLPEETGINEGHSIIAGGAGRLASGSVDKTIRIWDISTGISRVLTGHTEAVSSLVVLSDHRLASGSYDNTIRIWDLSTRTSQILHGHTEGVTSVAVLPDGRLVSGSYDNTIRIWNLSTGTSRILKGHTTAVMSLTVLPDGRLVSGSYDNVILIWV